MRGKSASDSRDFSCFSRHGSALTDAILNEWAQLTCFWKGGMGTEESKMAAITLLTKLILIDSSVLSHKFASAHVFQMYTSLLVDKATSLPFKVSTINFSL